MATADLRPDWLAQLREICLGLPEASEKETWEHPTFRVRDKIFAGMGTGEGSTAAPSFVDDASGPVTAITMKAAPGEQASLLAQGPPFFRPKYVGNRGWIGIVIDDETDWAEVEELVLDSYLAIAPKKLGSQLAERFDGVISDVPEDQ